MQQVRRIAIAAALSIGALVLHAQPATQAQHTQLVIVVDGLRPDYVTPDVMPRLARLAQRGIVFNAHHATFPTVTRVNASSFVTGAYPETHGILGNTIYIPAVNATRGLDTGERDNLEAVASKEGRLLTAPSLGEILQQNGKKLLAVSSGSTGSAFLLNHTVAGGAIIHYGYVLPPALAPKVSAMLGPPPPHANPNDPQNQYAIDAYLKVGLDEIHPDVTLMWLNDPDGTAHGNGIGAPLTTKSLSLVDAGIGRIEDALRARGLLDRTNIIVASDHGFSTQTGELNLDALVESFTKTLDDGSKDIVVAEGAIYLRGRNDPARIAAIVAALQKRPEVGAIFTKPGPGESAEGAVPGTLSFDLIHWNHPRAGDILVSANWTATANGAGFKGTTTQNGGVAGHGTSSRFDIHNTLIAAGPDFRERATSDVPTANVDVAPTLLRLLGLPTAPTMTGRVIEEGLRGGAPAPAVERKTETVRSADGRYQLAGHFSITSGRKYFDFTEVVRKR